MKREHFELKSVTATKEGVKASFIQTFPSQEGDKKRAYDTEDNIEPHGDLLKLFKELEDALIKAYGFGKKSEVSCHKVSISGKDQLRGAVLSGKLKSWSGSMLALNTPRITFSSEKIGLEKDVQETIDYITEETYRYFFEHKAANPNLFSEEKAA